MLRDAVDRRSVAVKAEADSWQPAVELSGELLAAEVVEERYGPAMIRMVEVLGPYMAVAPICCLPASLVDDSTCGKGRLRAVTIGECLRISDAEALQSSTHGAGTLEELLNEPLVPPADEGEEIRQGEALTHQVAVLEGPEGGLLWDRWIQLAKARRGSALLQSFAEPLWWDNHFL